LIELSYQTGLGEIDRCLALIIARVTEAFGQRIRGCYLVGSYAVGEPIPTSDIDMLVIFKDTISDDEHGRFTQVRRACQERCATTLDLTSQSEARLLQVGGVWFQTASRLVYGEDIRPLVPRKPVADHKRDLMHAVIPLLARVRGNPPVLSLPLDYPDPQGPLFGYDQRTILVGAVRRSVGTKDLVSNSLAIANALTLQAAGSYVGEGRKADIVHGYGRYVGGEWAPLVEQIFTLCRVRWGYEAPSDAVGLAQLRSLCEQVLSFENHFMDRYRAFLAEELEQPDSAAAARARQALGRLGPAAQS
jgi:predicted nucleotidyltransferase